MSTTVCRTRPVDRHLAAPTVRLASPLVIADSWSDRSTGSPSEAARVSPSTDTASACATSGTRRANEVSSQSRPPSASFVGSAKLFMLLLVPQVPFWLRRAAAASPLASPERRARTVSGSGGRLGSPGPPGLSPPPDSSSSPGRRRGRPWWPAGAGEVGAEPRIGMAETGDGYDAVIGADATGPATGPPHDG